MQDAVTVKRKYCYCYLLTVKSKLSTLLISLWVDSEETNGPLNKQSLEQEVLIPFIYILVFNIKTYFSCNVPVSGEECYDLGCWHPSAQVQAEYWTERQSGWSGWLAQQTCWRGNKPWCETSCPATSRSGGCEVTDGMELMVRSQHVSLLVMNLM